MITETVMPEDAMLTTIDNPFNPFKQYDAWLEWDEAHGYYTNGLLARYVRTSDELSEPDQALAINQAIEEVVKDNFSGKHKKIVA